MPMPQKYRDELIASHEAAYKGAKGETFRDLLRTAGHLAFWVACGLALIGFAWHTAVRTEGLVYWWAGHVVWIAGVGFSLLAAYRRGEKRGDW